MSNITKIEQALSDNEILDTIDGTVTRSANLVVEDFSRLNVPAGAVIVGITVVWTGGTDGWNEDDEVMRVHNGSSYSELLSANESTTAYNSIGTVTFGGPTNLWGLTWTPSTVNGIKINFIVEGSGVTAYHDAIEIRVNYRGGKLILEEGKIILAEGKITL